MTNNLKITKLNMFKLNDVGDTIVEVLIATAIVSLILGGAYATSTRSLKTTRQAEERVEALKYTESQLERLRTSTTASTGSSNFCFAADGSQANITPTAPLPNARDDTFPVTTYPVGCRYPTGGITYYVWISRAAPTTTPAVPPFASITSHTFTVHTRWPSYGSSITDEVILTYRVAE